MQRAGDLPRVSALRTKSPQHRRWSRPVLSMGNQAATARDSNGPIAQHRDSYGDKGSRRLISESKGDKERVCSWPNCEVDARAIDVSFPGNCGPDLLDE